MKAKLFLFVFLLPLAVFSQMGGAYVYDFLTIPVSPRAAALGGSAIGIADGDITLVNDNPALLNKYTDGKLDLAYVNYMADVNLGYTSYARHYDKIGTFGLGIQYLDGGEFIAAQADGTKTGTFYAKEMALNLSYAKAFDSTFSIGVHIKPVYSKLESVNSWGLVMDVGAIYKSRNQPFTAALVIKNMGAQLTTYYNETAPVPFEIQAGISTKLEHAPFRFSIVAHNLQNPDLTAVQTNYPEPTNVTQETEDVQKAEFIDKLMRHMIFGVEFTPSKSFFVRGGFNYMRRQELKLEAKPGMVGFSWGFGFRIKKINLSYANVRYHYAGISNNLAITTNLNSFFN